nr:hypothetical protein [uncultured Hyphomonas sp.]
MAREAGIVIVAIPLLILQLEHELRKKGELLTEEEVLAIRDRAPCIEMEAKDAELFAETRGRDLDFSDPWPVWSAYQKELLGK